MNRERSTALSTLANIVIFLTGFSLPLAVIPSFGGVEQFATPGLALLSFLAFISFFVLAASFHNYNFKTGISGAAAIVFVILLFLSNRSIQSNTPLVFFCSLIGIFFLAKQHSHERCVSVALSGILLGGSICSLAGILEFFHVVKLPEVVNWGNRAAGLFSDPNWYGLHAAICLLLAMSGRKHDGAVLKFIRASAIPLCAAALILSGSRSSWTSFALSLPVFALTALAFNKKSQDSTPLKNLAATLLALVIISAFVSGSDAARNSGFSLPERIKSIPTAVHDIPSGRANFIAASKIMITEKPFTGVGSGNFPSVVQRVQGQLARKGELLSPAISRTRHAYNDYLETGATAGLPALLFYILFLASVFASAVFGKGRAPSPGFGAAILCYALFGAFLQSAINNIPSSAIVWIIAGIAAGSGDAGTPALSVRNRLFSTLCLVAACFVFYYGAYAPLTFQSHISMAENMIAREKYDEAAIHAKKAVKIYNASPKAHLILSNIAMASGGEDLSIKELEAAIKASPYDADLHMKAGEMLMETSRLNDAAKHFYETIMLSTGDRSRAFLKYSETLLQQGYVDEALQTIKTGVMEYPKKAELHAQASRVFFEKRELMDSLSAAQAAVSLDDQCAVCFTRLSQALFAAGDFRGAYNAAQKGAELDPYNKYIPRLIAALRIKLNNEQ